MTCCSSSATCRGTPRTVTCRVRRMAAPSSTDRSLSCGTGSPPTSQLRTWSWSAPTCPTASRSDVGPPRQRALERLLIEPARRRPDLRFVVAGPQYPATVAWPANVERIDHLPPAEHPAFYAAQRLTLNITRADMIRAGWSPSVRLFEAAACAVPVVSDRWDGLDQIFRVPSELLIADTTGDVLAALEQVDATRRSAVGSAARVRVLGEHTAEHRAEQLESLVAEVRTKESV